MVNKASGAFPFLLQPQSYSRPGSEAFRVVKETQRKVHEQVLARQREAGENLTLITQFLAR